MRIFFAGNIHIPHSSENSVVRQLVRENHEVIQFRYPTISGTDYNAVNKRLFALLKKERIDLLIGAKCMGLSAELLKKIKVPKVSWVFDLFQGYTLWNRAKWYEEQATVWDCCFGPEGGQVDYYREKGINYHHLKCGADPIWHKKSPYDPAFEPYKCDVSFLGGLYNPLRINMASRVRCITNMDFKNFVGYEVNNQMIPGMYMEDISKFANVCKISIGCNYANNIPGYWSKRIYELMGSNMFMINAWVEGMEKEGFSKKNTGLFFNDDFDEMVEQIEYYLKPENEDERNKIREAGYQLVHKSHMMANRTESFFRTLKKEGVI